MRIDKPITMLYSEVTGGDNMNYLSIKQLQEELSICRQTIYRWMDKGLPVIRIGGLVRFDAEEVKKWINENRR